MTQEVLPSHEGSSMKENQAKGEVGPAADDVNEDVGQAAPPPEKSVASPVAQELADAVGRLIASAKAFVRETAVNLVEGGLAAIDEGEGKNRKGE